MKNKSFRYLWLGQSLANLGDVLYIVALISMLYIISESAFYLALLPFINTFGRFVSGFLSAILFNYFALKKILVLSQTCKTSLLLVLAFTVSFGLQSLVIPVFCFIFFIAFLDGWAMPATRAMLPRLVEESELVKANSFVAIVNETLQLGAWTVGGMIVAILGGEQVIWLTLGLFVLSSFMMFKIEDHTSFERRSNQTSPLVQIKDGWRIIWEEPLYRSIHVMILMETMASVVWIAAILYVFVNEVLQKPEEWWGYINATFFFGLIVGGFICSRLVRIFERNMRSILLSSSICISIITLWFGINSIAWLALVLSILVGVVEQIKSIAIETYLQKESNTQDLPKLYGAQGALIAITFGVSSLLFGGLADWLGIRAVFLLSGILLVSSAFYLFFRRLRLPANY